VAAWDEEKHMLKRFWPIFIILAIWITATTATGAQQLSPLETIQKPIDQIMGILNDPAFHAEGQLQLQRQKIWEVASPMFDFEQISQRAVGSAWDRFSDEQKQRFVKIFSEFLGNTYIDKIQGEYHNEKIVFLSELVRGPLALARTKLVRESLEIPIDYRMRQVDNQWKIYDVLVENGVSLVKNYHVQFQSILKDQTPEKLIEILEQKLANQKASA
jgi:phospholipid transport system substrate-binding protein